MLQIICPIHGSSNGIFTTQGMICQTCLNKKIEDSLQFDMTNGQEGQLRWEHKNEDGDF